MDNETVDIIKSLELPSIDEVVAKLHSLFEQFTNSNNEWADNELIEAKITEAKKILTIICDIYDTHQKSQIDWGNAFSVNNITPDKKSYWRYDNKTDFKIQHSSSALVDAHIISQYVKVKTLIDRYHHSYNEHFTEPKVKEQTYAFTEVKEE